MVIFTMINVNRGWMSIGDVGSLEMTQSHTSHTYHTRTQQFIQNSNSHARAIESSIPGPCVPCRVSRPWRKIQLFQRDATRAHRAAPTRVTTVDKHNRMLAVPTTPHCARLAPAATTSDAVRLLARPSVILENLHQCPPARGSQLSHFG